jgi:chitinase
MSEMRRLKLIQPNLEIWVAIGGWTFNDANQPTKTTFSDLARASEEAQNTFFDSLVSMMNTYGFDGVDLDWYVLTGPSSLGRLF